MTAPHSARGGMVSWTGIGTGGKGGVACSFGAGAGAAGGWRSRIERGNRGG